MEFRKSISRAARKGLIQLGLTGCGLALCVCAAFAQPFQLAQPVLLNDTPFFTDSVVIRMHFDLEGAEIRYTLDGKQPDRHSALYTGPITMHERCVLLAKAFHPDFQASEARIMSFIKVDAAYLPVKAELLFGPSPKYPGQGAATLMDLEKGHADFSDGRWLGFYGVNLEYTFFLKESLPAKKLMVSVLSAPGSWIFPPYGVQVWALKDTSHDFEKVAEQRYPKLSSNSLPMEEKMLTVTFPKECTAGYWKVVVENYGPLPDWHPGKGQPAWLFVDEIILLP